MVPGDTHDLCVVCLGAEHARSALVGADAFAAFESDAFAPLPEGSF